MNKFLQYCICILYSIQLNAQTSSNLLAGIFSVSDSKKVQFTKGNLYWDGSIFQLEEIQSESSIGSYATTYDSTHVSHFFWTNDADYNSGMVKPYAKSYTFNSQSTSDKFWCGEDNPITVNGTDDLYVLTGGNNGEWYYLFNKRPNASKLYKLGVTVTSGTKSVKNCLIIAPDDFNYSKNELKTSYTIAEVNNLGLVCLPCLGNRRGCYLNNIGSNNSYWTATPYTNNSSCAYDFGFSGIDLNPNLYSPRYAGYGIRLVRTINKNYTYIKSIGRQSENQRSKYIQNGTLIIQKNGKKYNSNGLEIK